MRNIGGGCNIMKWRLEWKDVQPRFFIVRTSKIFEKGSETLRYSEK